MFFSVQGNDAFLIGINSARLNVSKGQRLIFAANGGAVSGIIINSKGTPGPWASVTVETETPIPLGAQLSIPSLPETGGCGLAQPTSMGGRVRVALNIGYSYLDISTVGK